jgi:hypothetical protein
MGRTLHVRPYNLEAEESVLGACLLSREAVANVLEVVRADDFYKPAHTEMFNAMLELQGLLRQYLGKSRELRQLSQADLDLIAEEMNGRPRKTLGWRTPAQTLNRVLDKSPSTAAPGYDVEDSPDGVLRPLESATVMAVSALLKA